jgi:hypothetical protein
LELTLESSALDRKVLSLIAIPSETEHLSRSQGAENADGEKTTVHRILNRMKKVHDLCCVQHSLIRRLRIRHIEAPGWTLRDEVQVDSVVEDRPDVRLRVTYDRIREVLGKFVEVDLQIKEADVTGSDAQAFARAEVCQDVVGEPLLRFHVRLNAASLAPSRTGD